MTALVRLILGKNPNYEENDTRMKIGIMSGALGICLNLILFGFKYFVGFLAKSMAIMADSFNNLTDSLSSLVMAIGFKISSKRADDKHPFGHGRMEYIAALVVDIIIVFVGFELSKSSIEKIINPVKIMSGYLQIVILLVSVFVKIYMAIYNRYYGKKINSPTMEAVFRDSFNDVITTTVVLISIIIAPYLSINLDGVFGLCVAVLILISGFKGIWETVNTLIGKAADPDKVKKIEDYINKMSEKYDYIIGMHDLVMHDYGPGRSFFSLHVEVDSSRDIFVIHEKIDEMEKELSDLMGGECVIHIDPILMNDETLEKINLRLDEILHQIDPELSKHDVRMVHGERRINIIFDVVRPFKFKLKDSQLEEKISTELKKTDNRYKAIIKFDYPFA
ncbi:MAG: cation diffusion facilitator family transporter [Clostridia bacterium]|nr:cation diffusion facilitator family transporter [Clostridia bacterium]